MNKKYLINIVDVSDISTTPLSQKKLFPWELLLFACLILPLFSPDLRKTIDFDYSITSNKKHTLNSIKK